MKLTHKLFGLALLAATLAVPLKAVPYLLSTPNAAITPYPTPFGSVNVTLNGTGNIATITFTGNSVGGYSYAFGGSGAVDFNLNYSGATTLATTWGGGGTLSPDGSGNISSFGSFNYTFDMSDGAGDATTPISIQVTRGTGTWANANDVLTANADGFLVAAHVFVYSGTWVQGQTTNNVATGFAANGDTPPRVPDGGATVGLLGLALFGIAMFRRKFGHG